MTLALPGGLLLGCRVPRDFFVTSGVGESDLTVHAGSYHLALKAAGIEMCNILTYSSILPKGAREIEHPDLLVHGCVLETISSVCSVSNGELGAAGVSWGWLVDRESGEDHGGLVVERQGNCSEEEVGLMLKESLAELHANGYSERYALRGIRSLVRSVRPEKGYGTALVALGFVNHVYPVLSSSAEAAGVMAW